MEISSYLILSLVICVVLVQGVLFSLLIFRNNIFRNASNKYFAFFLIVLVIIGADSLLSPYYPKENGFWFAFFDIFGDDIPWIMLVYLPLFTFFLKVTDSKIKIPIYYFYLPFLAFLVINLLIDLDVDYHLISIPELTDHRSIFYYLEDYIAIVLFLSLHLFLFFSIIRHSSNKWLKKLWWGCSTLILLWVFLFLEQVILNSEPSYLIFMLLWGAVSIFIYWLIYTGLFQFNLANNRSLIKEKLLHESLPLSVEKPKSKTTNAYFDKLLELMEEETIYRNADLSREIVAQKLGISNSYLTQLIKENAEMSFTSFINQYRVKDVERMLKDSSFENFDVLSIGLEAGFKSKSAFYSTFKKINGATPTQFRKKES